MFLLKMENIFNMEANIKMSTTFRGLGLLVSCLFTAGVLSSIFTDNSLALDVMLFGAFFVLLVAPVCILGYIPGKVLDHLPNFVVITLKGTSS